MSRALMLQGTGSDVGKSLVVAGLCRAFSNRGLRVAPFKPQNMSNNAAVTVDGGEIGRAQALQARAARRDPVADMNPVLLKPQSGSAQIVLRGKTQGAAGAREYQTLKAGLLPGVVESFDRLKAQSDIVVVEGAGSAAEINLRAGDIANMGFARAVGAPVLLVGDIDRGGVIAQIVGCKAVLDPADAALVRGFIVNKFRGDASLFASGMTSIEAHTGWRGFGLLPFFEAAARLPAEDAFGLTGAGERRGERGAALVVAAPRLPFIANFDDLDPLRAEDGVSLVITPPGEPLPAEAALIVLPGSKATLADLAALREEGWDIDLFAHVRRGGRVLGLCGGYQMLGRRVADPYGVEGAAGEALGLGLLDVETTLGRAKTLKRVSGAHLPSGAAVEGFEMHMGETRGADCARAPLRFDDGRLDGAASPDGLVCGVYLHGLLASDGMRRALLESLGGSGSSLRFEPMIDATLDALADHCERHLDIDAMLETAR